MPLAPTAYAEAPGTAGLAATLATPGVVKLLPKPGTAGFGATATPTPAPTPAGTAVGAFFGKAATFCAKSSQKRS